MGCKIKIIYTRWLAECLVNQGFRVIGLRPNPNHPNFCCWVFENTEALNSALTTITQQKKAK